MDKREYTTLLESVSELRSLKSIKQKEEELRLDQETLRDNFSTFVNHTKEQLSQIQKSIDECSTTCSEKKVNIEDFKKALEGKANKHSVATALHRKANKKDVEEEFKKLIRNSDFDQLLQLLENKASNDDIERLETQLDDQIKKETIEEIISMVNEKANRTDYEAFTEQQLELERKANEKLVQDTQNQLSSLVESFNEQFELLRCDMYDKLQTKVDSNQILDFGTKLSKKADNDRVSTLIAQNKNNIIDILENYKKEFRDIKDFVEEKYQSDSSKKHY